MSPIHVQAGAVSMSSSPRAMPGAAAMPRAISAPAAIPSDRSRPGYERRHGIAPVQDHEPRPDPGEPDARHEPGEEEAGRVGHDEGGTGHGEPRSDDRRTDGQVGSATGDLPPELPGQCRAQHAGCGVADVIDRPERTAARRSTSRGRRRCRPRLPRSEGQSSCVLVSRLVHHWIPHPCVLTDAT